VDGRSQLRRALLSNRSRAYGSAGRHQQALEDALELVRCAPGWSKAWWRLARALQGLGRCVVVYSLLRLGALRATSRQRWRLACCMLA
jgi:hypothetical protein